MHKMLCCLATYMPCCPAAIAVTMGLQVRVYQFSETSKRLDCILFESVGSSSDNVGMTIQVSLGRPEMPLQSVLATCYGVGMWWK